MQADSTLRNRDRVYNAYRIEGICVTAAPDMSVEELAPQIRAFSPLYCHASAEELAAVGCHVIPEPGHEWPDALLVFPDRVTEELLDEVRPLFLRRGTRPNPNDKTGLLQ